MNITSLRLRRLLTTVGVVAALVLGFGSIKAAAAWTAAAAPLPVAPVAVSSIQDRLEAEQGRSVDMSTQLRSLAEQSIQMTAALEAAQARIVADAANAKALAKELKAAKAKLAKLEASIAKARQTAQQRQVTVVKTKTVTSTPAPTHHGDDDGEGPEDGG